MVDLDAQHFCSDLAREHRLLSSRLAKRRVTILQIVDSLREHELVRFEAKVVLDNVLSLPELRSDHPVGNVETAYAETAGVRQAVGTPTELRDDQGGGRRHACWRWEFPFKWSGPPEFGFWPDATGGDLPVFDNHMQTGFPPTIKWYLGPEDLDAYCYAPLSTGRANPPEELYGRAAEHVHAYVAAFNQQVREWLADIEAEVLPLIEAHQRDYRQGIAHRDQLLERFKDWRTGQLELAPARTQPRSSPPKSHPPVVELPPVVSEASLTEIIKVTNRWADAVEKSPAAYLGLEEERLSDQVVATLNGAFVHAEREVFVGGGKSDIYVSSTALDHTGLPDVYVGESKIWTGRTGLIKAIDQSLNNFTQRITNGILVVAVKHKKSFTNAKNRALKALADDSRVLEQAGDLAGRPVFHMRSALDPEAVVTLCLILVDMTRADDMLPKPKGKRAGTSDA